MKYFLLMIALAILSFNSIAQINPNEPSAGQHLESAGKWMLSGVAVATVGCAAGYLAYKNFTNENRTFKPNVVMAYSIGIAGSAFLCELIGMHKLIIAGKTLQYENNNNVSLFFSPNPVAPSICLKF